MKTFKSPPQSIEAEQNVLGGLMIDGDAIDKVADVLVYDDFYREDHAVIYEHMLQVSAENKPIDIITVSEALERSGWLPKVGGLPYLESVADNTASAANVKFYAEIVRDKSTLRRLLSASTEMQETIYSPDGHTAKNILDHFESKVMGIGERASKGTQGFVDIKTIMLQEVHVLQELYSREDVDSITGISTGFHDLDQKTMGLQPGDLIIVAGRPSMGKTTFAMNIAENAAISTGRPVAIFSMEMGSQQLARRMIGSIGHINQNNLRKGNLNDRDWDRVSSVMGKMSGCKIFMDESPALNALDLRSRARRLLKQQGDLGLIVIDYLQLMKGVVATENRVNEVSEITRALKSLAKELKVPVIALSQLNRGLEQRPNKRPIMSDLRESGSIEQDADLILFLYRDEVYHVDSDCKGTAEIIIGKQRNGEVGTVRLAFIGEHTRFENLSHDWSPQRKEENFSNSRFDRM